jgi:hypothetical protein
MSTKVKKDDKLYVSAEEVTKYLGEMATVLRQISDGVLESKDSLNERCKTHENSNKEGELNDGEQN